MLILEVLQYEVFKFYKGLLRAEKFIAQHNNSLPCDRQLHIASMQILADKFTLFYIIIAPIFSTRFIIAPVLYYSFSKRLRSISVLLGQSVSSCGRKKMPKNVF